MPVDPTERGVTGLDRDEPTTLVRHVVRRSLAIARPESSVDPSWPAASLLAMMATWASDLVRGFVVLVGVRGSRLRFCEEGVRVHGQRWCRFGRWLLLERGVTVRGRGGHGITLDDYVVIGSYSVLEVSSGLARSGGHIRIGRRSSMGDFCYVGGAGGVDIGRNVLIGQYVSFHSENHVFVERDRPIRDQGVTHKGIRVGDDCWIGAGAKVLDGVALGAGCIVAAGAVVTKSVPAASVVAGVPGRIVGSRGEPSAPAPAEGVRSDEGADAATSGPGA